MATTTPSAPVEPKVKVGAVVQYIAGAILVGLLGAVTDGNLIGFLPDLLAAFLAPLLPSLAALAAAYQTRHQYRYDEE